MSRENTAESSFSKAQSESQMKLVKMSDDYKHILRNHQKLLQTDMGTFPDYQHEIQITPDAVPVVT